jgi:hypothetical protein
MAMKTNVTTPVVSALAVLLLLVPLNASAGIHGAGMRGAGMHPFHFRGHFHFVQHNLRFFRNRQAFSAWPGYGYYDAPSYDDSMNYSSPQVVVVREPAPRPPCQHSEQTVTVPSENGGTRQVTILRC